MRNDVKLGFAIGGVLLAVLIVYVLVVPGSSGNKQTRLDNKAKADQGKVSLEPTTQASAPPAAPAGQFTPQPLDPAAATTQPSQVASADAEKPEPAPPPRAKDIDWSKLLNDQPVLMIDTPVAAGQNQPTQGADIKTAGTVPPLEPQQTSSTPRQEIVRQPEGGVTVYPPPTPESTPTTRPAEAPSAGRPHIVQPNETLSTISIVAYGSANYWPAIVKANPKIDPNRMKVGTTIVLPDISAVKPAEPQHASARVAPTAQIDATKQYRVVPGDSLHKISFKLYGKSLLADRIYELNKQAIGDDPARLKVGQVLQLPEPPTVSASR